jgi:hypothetical protein
LKVPMAHGPVGPSGLPGEECGPVEGRVIWAGAWRMRSGRLAEHAEREEVLGSDFTWALAQ